MIDPEKNEEQPSEQPAKAPAEIQPNHPTEIELPPVDDPKIQPPKENESNQNIVGPQSPSTSPTEQPRLPEKQPMLPPNKMDTVTKSLLGNIIKQDKPILNSFAQNWDE